MPERVLPREFAIPPEFLLPLSNAELQELGTFTAIWSQVDWIIMMIVCHLTKTEMGSLQLVMESMTTGPRVNLLKKLCQDRPNDIKKAITKVCDDNSGLIEDRNHILHGLWAIEWDCGTGTTEPACLFQKNRRKPIYAKKLAILSERGATGQSQSFSEPDHPGIINHRPHGHQNRYNDPFWIIVFDVIPTDILQINAD
jgi:hypothetical protein